VYILLFFFLYIFDREREREEGGDKFFSLPTTTPDNKTVSRWFGLEAVEGGKKWANASSQNQSAAFSFSLGAVFRDLQ
jgi:hypothetical protein